MYRAHLSLTYGLDINAWSLARAAKACPLLAGPLLALDLITRRLGHGTLQTSSGKGAHKTSERIWSLIRRELSRVALKDVETNLIWDMRCRECWDRASERRFDKFPYDWDEYEVLPRHFDWTEWGTPACAECAAEFHSFVSRPDFGAEVRQLVSMA